MEAAEDPQEQVSALGLIEFNGFFHIAKSLSELRLSVNLNNPFCVYLFG
jgi:hypothetical protein|tara:strand:- start:2952 stop:3098 length:147 start_codon:yes stop_codon:yes gene_type:complete